MEKEHNPQPKASGEILIELNKIYNENCLETMARMPDKFIDLTLTDFPYGIGENYIDFEDTNENLRKIVGEAMPEILRVSKRALITCGNRNMFLYPPPTWTLAWISSAGCGRNPWGFTCWQPILAYGKDPYLENRLGSRRDIFESNETSEKNSHPCPKPYKLWRDVLIRGSVKDTDIIYDPFMGSGTTALVSEDLGRQWVGSEISKGYVELANKRILIFKSQTNLFK